MYSNYNSLMYSYGNTYSSGRPIDLILGIIILCVILIVLVLEILIWVKILSKTGFGGALGCLMFIPGVNIILLIILAFTEWPIERRVKELEKQVSK